MSEMDSTMDSVTADTQEQDTQEATNLPEQDGKTDEIANLQEQLKSKDRGFNKMKERYESEIGSMKQQIDEFSKKFDAIEQKESEVKIPDEPKVPYNYNLADADDPNSETSKYLRDKQAYDDARIRRAEQKALSVEEKFNKTQMAQKQEELNARARQQVIQSFEGLGRAAEEAQKIVEYYYSPESLTPEALLRGYDANHPKKDRGAEIDQRRKRSETPAPVAVGGGQHTDSLSEADMREAAKMNVTASTYIALKEKRKKVREANKKR